MQLLNNLFKDVISDVISFFVTRKCQKIQKDDKNR